MGHQIKTKEIALRMVRKDSTERKEAEIMMGVKFEEMTKPQRLLAAQVLAAFGEVYNKKEQ